MPVQRHSPRKPPKPRKSHHRGVISAGNVAEWLAAASVVHEVAAIILQEKIGFNVTTTGSGTATVDAFYAITGCVTPTKIGDRGCEKATVTSTHVVLECWTDGYAAEWDEIRELYPSLAPVRVGNMGYNGKASYFFSKTISDAAWETEGLNLDYYRGYNVSWHDAAKYFDSPLVVNTSRLMPCNKTRLMISSVIKFYLEQTGDSEGVEVDGEEYRGKCFDEYFWYPPSCRSTPSRCFIYITGGNGWDMEGTMQKVTAFNIPMASTTAADYTAFTELPPQLKSMFYWWIPDPTFFGLEPLELMFPPYDRQAWLKGDKRTASTTSSVDIAVSGDLQALAPNVKNFLENWNISIKEVDKMLLDQIQTGDDSATVACRWVQNHDTIWLDWLPDTTKCFAQFGLYNTLTNEFVTDRADKSFLECRACSSGTYSAKLTDADGETHVCSPCPPGTAQPSGAALKCDPCLSGEYQDLPGQTGCRRCVIGEYQDHKGQKQCIPCVAGTTTLGDGRPKVDDCGCIPGSIDIGDGGNMSTCISCGAEGLTCPFSASEQGLKDGTAPNGADFVPVIVEGYYSTEKDPLKVYKCRNKIQCPGGKPQTCGGGLEGLPCAECPSGQTWSGTTCEECTLASILLWICSVVAIFGFLTLAYYLLTSQVTAKASVMATTGMSFGMTVGLLQSVGIIGMMTVEWPGDLQGFLAFFQVLLLDIDSYSFSCFAGSDTAARYLVSVSFFFLGQAWLLFCFSGSRLLPRKWRWDPAKTASTMGQFWQVGFSTMSTVSMAPLTCYTHPNGLQSLLKYPNIICGGDNGHALMMVGGIILLVVGVFGFLAVCIYAAYMMPAWSSGDKRHMVQSFRFLVFRFRLDSWWYGVPLLVRGPLLSLPIALATDFPPVQTIMVNVILSVFMLVETLSWPWKVPLLNLVDMWMSLCLMLLVTGSALYVDTVTGDMQAFASTFSTVVMGGIGLAMAMMGIVAVGALVHRTAMGGAQEYAVFNLGQVPAASLVKERMLNLSKELLRLDETWVQGRITSMSAFDIRLITACITLLAIDLVPHKADDLKFNFARVSAQSFAVRGKTQKNIYKADLPDAPRVSAVDMAKELEKELAEEEEPEANPELKEGVEPMEANMETIETNEVAEVQLAESPSELQQNPFKSGWV